MDDYPVIESSHEMRKWLAEKGAKPEEVQAFMAKCAGKDSEWLADYFAGLVMIVTELGMDRVAESVMKNAEQ